MRRVGKGRVAYVAGEVFAAYQVKNPWNLKHVVKNLLLNCLLVEDRVVDVEAPAWLEVVLMQQPERFLVHLVNHHGNRPVDGNNVCVEHVLPVREVTVRLQRAARPTQVTLEPGGRSAAWEYANGYLQVHVPEVRIHTAIAVS